MTITKRVICLFLAAAMSLGFFISCGDESKTGTTAALTDAEEPEPESRYTDEERAEFAALAAKYAERAEVIASATISKYINLTSYKRTKVISLAETVLTSNNKFTASGSASVWHYTSFLAMLSRLTAVSSEERAGYYSEMYPNAVESMKFYEGTATIMNYTDSQKVSMYAVHRAGSKGTANITGVEAVYDDQMWIIREMIYSYRLTGDPDYLEEAERLTDVCLQGWDVTLDSKGNEYGGICWGPGYSSKHTCSNAPLILPLVNLYEIYTEKGDTEKAGYYLDFAIRTYDFTVKHFRLGNYLYGDNMGTQRQIVGVGKNRHYETTGQNSGIESTTYTYNTGAMIAGGAALYRVTGEEKYLTGAKKSTKASLSNFPKKNKDGLYEWPNGRQWFNLILLEGVFELYPYDEEGCLKVIESFANSIDFAYDNYLNEGFLPKSYLSGWKERENGDINKDVMDQTSAATIYAELAAFYLNLSKQ